MTVLAAKNLRLQRADVTGFHCGMSAFLLGCMHQLWAACLPHLGYYIWQAEKKMHPHMNGLQPFCLAEAHSLFPMGVTNHPQDSAMTGSCRPQSIPPARLGSCTRSICSHACSARAPGASSHDQWFIQLFSHLPRVRG